MQTEFLIDTTHVVDNLDYLLVCCKMFCQPSLDRIYFKNFLVLPFTTALLSCTVHYLSAILLEMCLFHSISLDSLPFVDKHITHIF